MADWAGPFHLPKFTKEEFDERKRKYNEKYGYTVTVPAFKDIIHLFPFPPMTEHETALWKARKYEEIPPGRLEQIRDEKARKKAKFLAMMSSPSPKILRSAGAILTSLDDLQDAVSTLACIGLITAAVIGGTTAAVLAGPLGWVVGASALLNLVNPFSRLRGRKKKAYTGRAAKKEAEKLTDKNPFSKKARIKATGWWPHMPPPEGMTIRPGTVWPKGWEPGDKFPKGVKIAKGTKIPWGKIKNFSPTMGNAIEALQVTDNIWGYGVCIGPIMGFVQDVLSAKVRMEMGQKVKIELAPGFFPEHLGIANNALRAICVMQGRPWKSDFMDETYSFIAANLAQQVLAPYLEEYNPMVEIDDLAKYEIEAPRPTDILILEIIEETGYTVDEVCNWPQNGERWISYGELAEKTAEQATENLRHYAEKNKNSALAFIAGQNAHDFALHSLAAWEGEEQVEIEYLSCSRIIITILDNGWCYPDDIRMDQVRKFEDWCYVHEYMGTVPGGKEIWRYAEMFCDFRWATSEDEYR